MGMTTIAADEEGDHELGRNVRRLHGEIMQSLAELQHSITPDSVHDARTAIRRLLGVLSGYKPLFKGAPRRKYVRALKRMTAKLDAIRDADVMQKTVLDLAGNAARSKSKERRALIGMTCRNRRQRMATLSADMASGRWRTRVARLQYLASASLTDIKSPGSAQSSVPRILKRGRRRLRSALDYHGNAPRHLHRLRSKVRRMRYILELAASLDHDASRLEIERLHRLQESLGALHDAWVLHRAVKKRLGDEFDGGHLTRKLRKQRRQLFRAYRSDRKALLHEWAKR
jgi:CHAD domain-containing protein